MPAAAALRIQIEAALAQRIPAALTPAPRIVRPTAATGVDAIDQLLEGGLPLGALTEMAGPECSGRTTMALSFLARLTQEGRVCAWIDVGNSLSPESAASAGVVLPRLLWVRCGARQPGQKNPASGNNFILPQTCLAAPPTIKGLHGGSFGPHPREEEKGLSKAMSGLFQDCRTTGEEPRRPNTDANIGSLARLPLQTDEKKPTTPWTRLEEALRVTDLLLQGGGFSAIVLDMGSIAPAYTGRVPMATWFRYRASAERSQAAVLLLSQHPCAKSSAGLALHLTATAAARDEKTIFTGMEHRIEVQRQRFAPSPPATYKKPVQRADTASWKSRTNWAGRR